MGNFISAIRSLYNQTGYYQSDNQLLDNSFSDHENLFENDPPVLNNHFEEDENYFDDESSSHKSELENSDQNMENSDFVESEQQQEYFYDQLSSFEHVEENNCSIISENSEIELGSSTEDIQSEN